MYNFNSVSPYLPQNAYQQKMELIRVNGMDGARAYQMPPNSTVALFDGGNDVMYIKTTDGAGFPVIRTFEFKEINQNGSQPDPAQFVSIEEFNKLKEEIENVKQLIREGQSKPNPAFDARSILTAK